MWSKLVGIYQRKCCKKKQNITRYTIAAKNCMETIPDRWKGYIKGINRGREGNKKGKNKELQKKNTHSIEGQGIGPEQKGKEH